MEIPVVGLGKGGNRVLDAIIEQVDTSGSDILQTRVAIDSDKSDLIYLENVPASQQALVGESEVKGQGTSGNIDLGKKFIGDLNKNFWQCIRYTIGDDAFMYDADAYLLITGSGGGMAGGGSELITILFNVLGTDAAPAYAVVVSPRSTIKEPYQSNAAANFEAISSVADGIIHFHNEAFARSGGENWIADSNDEISKRIYKLFSEIEISSTREDSNTGLSKKISNMFSKTNSTTTKEGAITLPELKNMFEEEGIVTVGYASKKIETGTNELVGLADSSISSGLQMFRESPTATPIIVIILGPKSQIGDKKAVDQVLRDSVSSDIDVRTRIDDKLSKVEIISIISKNGNQNTNNLGGLDANSESDTSSRKSDHPRLAQKTK